MYILWSKNFGYFSDIGSVRLKQIEYQNFFDID